jgi:hypothetical protein
MLHLNRKSLAAAAVMALAASSAMAGTWYNSEASFVSAIQPNPYIEDFSNFTFGSPLDGTQLTWAAPGGNGYGWTASAPGGLYSNVSALSTNFGNDPVTINFTAGNVTALGGNFTNTDITGAQIPGTVTVTTSDGGVQSITSNPASFLGYTSTVPIVSVTFTATSAATNNWVQIDHFYTGTAGTVPEPASLSVIGLAVAGLATRHRRS